MMGEKRIYKRLVKTPEGKKNLGDRGKTGRKLKTDVKEL
jgi:hypothetical protein